MFDEPGFKLWKPGCIGWGLLYFLNAFIVCFMAFGIAAMVRDVPFSDSLPDEAGVFIFLIVIISLPLYYFIPNGIRYHFYMIKIKEKEYKKRQKQFANEVTENILSIENDITNISKELGLEFRVFFKKNVEDYITNHDWRVLAKDKIFNRLLNEQTNLARVDQTNFRKALKTFKDAEIFFTDVSRDVNKTASIPLIRELDYLYKYLSSPNIKSLLLDKKWNEFEKIIKSILNDLKSLRETAIKYQESGINDEDFDDGYNSNELDDTIMTADKAREILGISPTLPYNKIKEVYRKLSAIYHPDSSIVEDEERMKKINEAMHFLEEERRKKK